jgi:hypothetical protein
LSGQVNNDPDPSKVSSTDRTSWLAEASKQYAPILLAALGKRLGLPVTKSVLGAGIAKEAFDRAIDKFFQTRQPGASWVDAATKAASGTAFEIAEKLLGEKATAVATKLFGEQGASIGALVSADASQYIRSVRDKPGLFELAGAAKGHFLDALLAKLGMEQFGHNVKQAIEKLLRNGNYTKLETWTGFAKEATLGALRDKNQQALSFITGLEVQTEGKKDSTTTTDGPKDQVEAARTSIPDQPTRANKARQAFDASPVATMFFNHIGKDSPLTADQRTGLDGLIKLGIEKMGINSPDEKALAKARETLTPIFRSVASSASMPSTVTLQLLDALKQQYDSAASRATKPELKTAAELRSKRIETMIGYLSNLIVKIDKSRDMQQPGERVDPTEASEGLRKGIDQLMQLALVGLVGQALDKSHRADQFDVLSDKDLDKVETTMKALFLTFTAQSLEGGERGPDGQAAKGRFVVREDGTRVKERNPLETIKQLGMKDLKSLKYGSIADQVRLKVRMRAGVDESPAIAGIDKDPEASAKRVAAQLIDDAKGRIPPEKLDTLRAKLETELKAAFSKKSNTASSVTTAVYTRLAQVVSDEAPTPEALKAKEALEKADRAVKEADANLQAVTKQQQVALKPVNDKLAEIRRLEHPEQLLPAVMSKLKELLARRSDLEGKAKAAAEDVQRLRAQTPPDEANAASAQTKHDRLRERIAKLAEEINAAEGEIGALKLPVNAEAVAKAKSELAPIKVKSDAYLKEIFDLEKKLKEAKGALQVEQGKQKESIAQMIAPFLHQNGTQVFALSQAAEAVKDYENRLQSLKATMESNDRQSATFKEENASFANDADPKRKERVDRNNRLIARNDKENGEIKTLIPQVDKALEEARANLAKSKKESTETAMNALGALRDTILAPEKTKEKLQEEQGKFKKTLEEMFNPKKPEGTGDGAGGTEKPEGKGKDDGGAKGPKDAVKAEVAKIQLERAEACAAVLNDPALSIQDKIFLFMMLYASYSDREREAKLKELNDLDEKKAKWDRDKDAMEVTRSDRKKALDTAKEKAATLQTEVDQLRKTEPGSQKLAEKEKELNTANETVVKKGEAYDTAVNDYEKRQNEFDGSKNRETMFLELQRVSQWRDQIMQMARSLLEETNRLIERIWRS